MKKILLIALIVLGVPAWAKNEIQKSQCEELTREVTLLILGDAPLELIYDAVKNREDNLQKEANENNKYAKFVASTAYRWVGFTDFRKSEWTAQLLITRVQQEVCYATNLELHYRN